MVYLSVSSVWASDGCGTRVGQGYSNTLISLKSTEVYSVCSDNVAYSYNFNDLTGYLPASAWNCMPYCYDYDQQHRLDGHAGPKVTGGPSVDSEQYINDDLVVGYQGGYCADYIYRDWYKPLVAVPPQIRGLDPAWASCDIAFQGWYDPPSALPQVTTIAAPSVNPASASPTPAASTSIVAPTSKSNVPTQMAASTPAGSDPSSGGDVPVATGGGAPAPSSDSNPDPQAQPGSANDPGAQSSIAADPAIPVAATPVSDAGGTSDPGQGSDSPNDPSSQDAGGAIVSAIGQIASGAQQSDPGSDGNGSPIAPAITISVGGSSFTVASDPFANGAVVDGISVAPGVPASVINGQTVSAAANGVYIGRTFIPYSAMPATPLADATFNINGGSFTMTSQLMSDGQISYLVNGVPIQEGVSTSIDGHIVSADLSGVYIDGTFIPSSAIPASNPASTTLNIDGISFAITRELMTDGRPCFVVNGIPVEEGNSLTIDGQTVSVDSAGIHIGTSFLPYSSFGTTTMAPPGTLVLEGVTLMQGAGATVLPDGRTASLGSNGLYIDGTATTLPASDASFERLGSMVLTAAAAVEGHGTTAYTAAQAAETAGGGSKPTTASGGEGTQQASPTLHSGGVVNGGSISCIVCNVNILHFMAAFWIGFVGLV
jgi:hypothetical protein